MANNQNITKVTLVRTDTGRTFCLATSPDGITRRYMQDQESGEASSSEVPEHDVERCLKSGESVVIEFSRNSYGLTYVFLLVRTSQIMLITQRETHGYNCVVIGAQGTRDNEICGANQGRHGINLRNSARSSSASPDILLNGRFNALTGEQLGKFEFFDHRAA